MNGTTHTVPKLRGDILKQIYRVWLFRKLAPVLLLEAVLISLFLYQMGEIVFVQRVIENAATVFFNDPPHIFQFFISAFTHAPVLTKVMTLSILLLVALILRHITQGVLRLILVRENFFSSLPKS
ncbi:MAG: hypothetical protein HYZ69_03395 [Candidatus Colwellbacteria bacterium]|nr:hypothetical protein [Candidatus Colwellbacteria bacterium]